jgi:hypothetical protein
LELARLTDAQKALLGIGLGLVPAVLGLAIPGGVVREKVDLDFLEIVMATLPWTASIAAIVWFSKAAPDDWHDLAKLGAVVGILGLGALIGVELIPEQAVVTEEQADQIPFYILAEQQGATVRGGVVIAHNPKVGLGIVLIGVAAFVTFVYATLYGVALWLAGLVCGAYLGWLLHKSFTDPGEVQAPSPTD